MNRIVLGAVFLVFIASIAAAQDEIPQYEVFGGYSLIHEAHLNLNGAAAELHYPLNPYFGIVGNVSYGHKSEDESSSSNPSTFDQFFALGGLRLSYRVAPVRFFFHALGGGVRLKLKGPGTGYGATVDYPYTGVAMAFGGGVDFSINDKISIRPAQLEWIREWVPERTVSDAIVPAVWADQFRYSVGIVYKFGERQVF